MALRSIVVVPARDEQDQIAGCLSALAAQTVPPEEFEVILVVDACTDRTAEVAKRTAREHSVRLSLIDGPGQGAGPARRVGMDLAAERLLADGREDGLVACTDADSRPAPDWLACQLVHIDAGADVVAGLIELDPSESQRLPPEVLCRRRRDATQRLEFVRETDPGAAHHHFAGASIGVTAGVYRAIGGIEPVTALEDAAFAQRLVDAGIPVLRADDVRVRTSARADGRATRGLSVDLAVSSWAVGRRYVAGAFPPGLLRRHKGATSVDVVIPTKECAETLGDVLTGTVRPLREAGLVDDVLVVDAGSADGTAEVGRAAGARVIDEDEVLCEYGPALGKGDAMWRALHVTSGRHRLLSRRGHGEPGSEPPSGADRAVACPPVSAARQGRIRPAVARRRRRPAQRRRTRHRADGPAAAEPARAQAGRLRAAARRGICRAPGAVQSIPFPVGYGVEIAVLIDALRRHGLDALAECHLGERRNRHQPLRALGEMAYAVLSAVERRAGANRSAIGGHYLRPWEDCAAINVAVAERPPLATLGSGGATSAPLLGRARG